MYFRWESVVHLFTCAALCISLIQLDPCPSPQANPQALFCSFRMGNPRGRGEMTKRGALLHGVPYGVPKMEYP